MTLDTWELQPEGHYQLTRDPRKSLTPEMFVLPDGTVLNDCPWRLSDKGTEFFRPRTGDLAAVIKWPTSNIV